MAVFRHPSLIKLSVSSSTVSLKASLGLLAVRS